MSEAEKHIAYVFERLAAYQKQVEKDFLLLQRGQKTIAKKPVRDEAEPTMEASDTIRRENFLFYYHGYLFDWVNHIRGGGTSSQSGHEYRKNGKMALNRYARYSFLCGLTSS